MRAVDEVNNQVVTNFAVSFIEPTKVLGGDFEGSGTDFNRLLSFLRER